MFRFDTPTATLRSVAFIEGVSYLVLLFVAMPLKYLADQPLGVTVVGSIHGALFVWGGWLVWTGMRRRGRSFGWGARLGIAALLPFGTFALDGRLKAEDEEYRRALAPARVDMDAR